MNRIKSFFKNNNKNVFYKNDASLENEAINAIRTKAIEDEFCDLIKLNVINNFDIEVREISIVEYRVGLNCLDSF